MKNDQGTTFWLSKSGPTMLLKLGRRDETDYQVPEFDKSMLYNIGSHHPKNVYPATWSIYKYGFPEDLNVMPLEYDWLTDEPFSVKVEYWKAFRTPKSTGDYVRDGLGKRYN